MRRRLRNQILEILNSMTEGIAFARKSGGGDTALQVLGDCFAAANMVAGALAGALEEGRAAHYAKRLEAVKAGLQALADSLAGPGVKEAAKTLRREIEDLERELRREKVSVEAVFLPYKASMWDSMESIWRAAEADPDCEAYVVPLPYYDRNPNRTLGRMHYEGDQMPAGVPVVDYEQYDFEARHPDIAYIHNPYDDRNYVTSLPKEYYSGALKEHVDTLVYVPYYVTPTASTDLLAQNAALISADTIIAGNEEDREKYLSVGAKADVAALGNPKVDRVLRMEAEKPEMPPAWRPVLEGRKVFLFNTSISSMLNSGQGFLDKIRAVLDCFEGREDAVLLWRPHPLSQSTIQSMAPGLLAGYRELEARFKIGGFGVYDDTSDLNRAIALADAYIGESSSSVVYLFSLTGKPLYLINYLLPGTVPTEAEREEWLRSARISPPLVEGEMGWSTVFDYSVLVKVNLLSGQVDEPVMILSDPSLDEARFGKPVRNDNQLVLPPLRVHCFEVYDPETGQWQQIPIPGKWFPHNLLQGSFPFAFQHEQSFFFTPQGTLAIAQYHIDSGTFTYHPLPSGLAKKCKIDDRFNFFGQPVQNGSLLLMPLLQSNRVLEFDMATGKFKEHTIGMPGTGYSYLAFDGSFYWLLQFRRYLKFLAPNNVREEPESIVRWNPKTGETTEFGDFPEGFECLDIGTPLILIHYQSNFLWAFPQSANMILKIDPATGVMSEFKTELDFPLNGHKSPYYQSSGFLWVEPLDDETLLGQIGYDNSLIKINTRTEMVEHIPLRINLTPEQEAALQKPARFHRNLNIPYAYTEHPLFPPASFVDALAGGEIPAVDESQAEDARSKVANGDGTAGEKIHAYVMRKARQ